MNTPVRRERGGANLVERVSNRVPGQLIEIAPHPSGVAFGRRRTASAAPASMVLPKLSYSRSNGRRVTARVMRSTTAGESGIRFG